MGMYEEKLNEVLQEIKFEFGTGLWIEPQGKVHKLPNDQIHAKWAKTHNMNMDKMLKDGWARVRVVADSTIGESYDKDQIFNVHEIAKRYGTTYITFVWYRDNMPKKYEYTLGDPVPVLEDKEDA
ncbi:MAG: hypothetical protein GF411_00990 [Candidatus Lokiarchaeota archaeon]|nr:hypothetical protein [Candidatus Lokiarchaeota archaeon]